MSQFLMLDLLCLYYKLYVGCFETYVTISQQWLLLSSKKYIDPDYSTI